jgi:hypothetical protein
MKEVTGIVVYLDKTYPKDEVECLEVLLPAAALLPLVPEHLRQELKETEEIYRCHPDTFAEWSEETKRLCHTININ